MNAPLFGVASDFHADFAKLNPEFFEWRGDVLLLAGDLAEEDHLRKMPAMWDQIQHMAKEVYVIAGNHEFYGSELGTTEDHLIEFLKDYPNIRFLKDEAVETHGVTIYGSTLWTDFDKGNPITMYSAGSMMNDYRKIRTKGYRKIKPIDIGAVHANSLFKMKNFLSEVSGPVIIMTHHAPSFMSVRTEFIGDKLNGAYASSLEEMILDHPQIKAWVHGHIHTFKDYMIGDCRVMVNARGYPGERNADKYGPYEVHPFRIEE